MLYIITHVIWGSISRAWRKLLLQYNTPKMSRFEDDLLQYILQYIGPSWILLGLMVFSLHEV
jgi:hypothetical protein